MFVSRSSLLNPSPLLRWARTTSPSRTSTRCPLERSDRARSWASVVLPAPESPVSQTTKPWSARLISDSRSGEIQDLANHVARDRLLQLVECGWGDITNMSALDPPLPSPLGIVADEHAKLRVIGVVGAGVVLKRIDALEPQTSHRSPVEVAKIDDEVRRDAGALTIDLLGLEDFRAHRPTLMVGQRPQLLRHLLAHGFIAPWRNGPIRFPPLHVKKDSPLVATTAPDLRAVPIHLALLERSEPAGALLEDEISFPEQPLVDAEAAFHSLGAVVREHPDHRLIVKQLQQLPDLPVERTIVVVNRMPVRIPRLMLGMLWVVVLPHSMMNSVHAYLDKHEEIPGLLREEGLHNRKSLLGHVVDLPEQVALVLGPEVRDVNKILTHQAPQLLCD